MAEAEQVTEKRQALIFTLVALLCLEYLALSYVGRGLDRAFLVVSMFAQAATLLTFLPRATTRSQGMRVSALAHTMFGTVMLLVPVLGRAPALLGLHACMALFTLASRSALDGCMYSAADGGLTLLDLGIKWDWDWAFAAAGGVSVVRLAVAAAG